MEKQLRESEERYFLATQGANDGLWDWDLSGNKIYFSPRWKSMLGYEDGRIGSTPNDWFSKIHPADREQVEKGIGRHLNNKSSHFESEFRILDSDGVYRWVLCRGLARRDKNGKAHRFAGSQTDITDRKVYNPLTGLPNKILFIDRLEHLLRSRHPQRKPFAVAVVEVGGLRTIASSFGYIFADRLLGQVAQIIQKCLSSNDTIAHFRNDDFGLILEQSQDAKQAANAASRLLRDLDRPFQIDGQSICVAAFVGITQCTHEYTCPDELIRDAYAAMHRVKDSGQGRVEIFDRKMRSSVVARLKLEADLRRAFEQNDFKIHYQPIVNLKTGALVGFEALLRWQKQNTLMYPEDFLSIADATGLLIPLERWVLIESCMQMAQWTAEHDVPLTLNVNLCPKHYTNHSLIEELKQALQRSGLDPRLLHLE
jgi:diguanylate cyclase (GGDEF)-like protein/PAS domain S-box-containing protein